VLSLKCYLNDKVVWLRGLRGVILYTFTRLHTEFGTLAFGLHRPRVAATLARARASHAPEPMCERRFVHTAAHNDFSVHAHCRTSTYKAPHSSTWILGSRSGIQIEDSRELHSRNPAVHA